MLNAGMRIEIVTAYADDSMPLASDAALAVLRAKLTGEGMLGWFISYPDRPVGSTVLCAACASDGAIVGKWLERQRARPGSCGYDDTYAWDGVEEIRPVDPSYNSPGWSPTRQWTCLACFKRGWPK